jgi:glucan phosphoethanolaminetransferase (alkaline phosphatase superfamily)
VTLAPWEYLFLSFDSHNFPNIFHPTWIASLVLLGVLIVLYIVRTRALHRHPPYTEMWEWLWWTGLITFSLIVVGAVFVFDFFLVLTTEVIGIGMLVWIRFRRYPPYLAAYEKQLAKQRYASTRKFSDPDATIRRRGGRRQRRRR